MRTSGMTERSRVDDYLGWIKRGTGRTAESEKEEERNNSAHFAPATRLVRGRRRGTPILCIRATRRSEADQEVQGSDPLLENYRH